MSAELAARDNRVFPGVSPGAWGRFARGCTYRWEHRPDSRYEAPYDWGGSSDYVPYRLGYDRDEGCSVEDSSQRAMALCLASRHHDGHERERALRGLLGCGAHPFVVPYLLRPLSEYVFPIYCLLNQERHALPVEALCSFRDENPAFMSLAWQRMRSYWHTYHRGRAAHFEAMPNVRFMNWLEQLQSA